MTSIRNPDKIQNPFPGETIRLTCCGESSINGFSLLDKETNAGAGVSYDNLIL
jgi:hypothetical protein